MMVSRLFNVLAMGVALLGCQLTSNTWARDCDCVHSSCDCNCQSHADSGLLDVVDRVAGRFQQQVRRTSRILQAELGLESLRSRSRSCDGVCDSGCDALLGSYLTKGSRGHCSSCENWVGSIVEPIDDTQGVPPVPPALGNIRSEHYRKGNSSDLKTQMTNRREPDRSEPNTQPADGPQAPRKLPIHHTPPDTMVDPFMDEADSSSGLRGALRTDGHRVKGQTIQYQRSSNPQLQKPTRTISRPTQAPTYRQRFDPQANNNATSADYWAGAEEELGSKSKKVAPASAQPPTLHEIHKRAYSLRLADQQPNEEAERLPTDAAEAVPSENASPARLPSDTTALEPLAAPVRQSMRLKVSPGTSVPAMKGPYDNPLR